MWLVGGQVRLRNGKGVENGRELVFENVGESWNSVGWGRKCSKEGTSEQRGNGQAVPRWAPP